MKKIYLITNWKMQLSNQEAIDLAKDISTAEISENVEVVVCPSFTALEGVKKAINDSQVKLGAQDVFYHEKGQYTGEISPLQLKETGVEYVILGHSERREFMNETDETVNRKLVLALENGLIPILCIGETLEEKREDKSDNVIIRQLTRCLEDVELKNNQKLIIAYEPVWAISPAPPAQPEDADRAVSMIKHLLLDFFEPQVIENNITIVYGGSVNAENLAGFLKSEVVNGALIGGAGLSTEKFLPLIKAVIK